MKLYKKRGRWCFRDKNERLYKFVKKTDALAYMKKLNMPTIEYDENDTIEEEKSIAEKMKKAEATVTLDDLQGSYE